MDSLFRRSVTRRRFIGGSATAAAALAVFGCAPPPSPNIAPSAPDPSVGATAGPSLSGRRPDSPVRLVYRGAEINTATEVASLTSERQVAMTNPGLSTYDSEARLIPMVAERVPSFDDGTWVLNPDGTMRVTWHLRPNAKWHDGTPFTSKDVRFSWEFTGNADVPLTRRSVQTNVTAIDTPDEHTVVMHWKQPDARANAVSRDELHLYPEHIMRPLFASTSGDQILAHPFFHDGFVGLGAFQVDRFLTGGDVHFKPFNDFFLGPPKLSGIVLRHAATSTGMLTFLLAGEVDMTGPNGLEFQDGVTAKEQWEAGGKGTVYFTPTNVARLLVRPTNPLLRDPRVRQALLLAIDREQIVRTFFRGDARIAHTVINPREDGYEDAMRTVVQYPFDPRQALALMEQAGWRRGSDSMLANAAGESFELPYRVVNDDSLQNQIQQAVAANWRDIGVRTIFDNVSARAYTDLQEIGSYTGVLEFHGTSTVDALFRRYHSSGIPRPETRFAGDNNTGLNLPQADRLLEQLQATLDAEGRRAIIAQFTTLVSQEAATLPLYYVPEPVAIAKGLLNARPRPMGSNQYSTIWNTFQWEWA